MGVLAGLASTAAVGVMVTVVPSWVATTAADESRVCRYVTCHAIEVAWSVAVGKARNASVDAVLLLIPYKLIALSERTWMAFSRPPYWW